MQRLKQPGVVRALIVYACIAAVMLVAGLQATHFHRDWLNPNASNASGHVSSGADTHCVLCVSSFAAALPSHVDAVESLVAHTDPPTAPVPIFYDHRAASDITIRPPPAL